MIQLRETTNLKSVGVLRPGVYHLTTTRGVYSRVTILQRTRRRLTLGHLTRRKRFKTKGLSGLFPKTGWQWRVEQIPIRDVVAAKRYED